MKLRYKRSVLGIVWSLLNPLAQLLVINFVFSRVIPLHVSHYATSTFTGLIAWTWFQAALMAATGAIVDNRELIRRPGFPVAVLPIVSVTTNLIHFLLSLPTLLIFMLLEGTYPTLAFVALPLVIALQYTLTLAISYVVATLNVPFRDTQYLLGVALLLGFFLTPVFYDSTSIPARYQRLYLLNPMALLLNTYRTILIQGQWPDGISLLGLGLLATGLLALGYRLFWYANYRFVEEL